MTNIEELSKELSKLTLLEAAELVKCLENKWGVKASNNIIANDSVKSEDEVKAVEKNTFDIILTSIGNKKIQVIKTVREITSLGLKEAKNLVDQFPKAIKSGISKDEAKEIKEKLEKVGASVEIK
jgi:large subunit ribosomal protein L7/L12